jgi:hypothetical protein
MLWFEEEEMLGQDLHPSLFPSRVFLCRVAAVATLPSALSMSALGRRRVGAVENRGHEALV